MLFGDLLGDSRKGEQLHTEKEKTFLMERCRKSLFRHCCCLKVSFPKLGSKMKMVMLQGKGEHNENTLKFDVSSFGECKWKNACSFVTFPLCC